MAMLLRAPSEKRDRQKQFCGLAAAFSGLIANYVDSKIKSQRVGDKTANSNGAKLSGGIKHPGYGDRV